MAQPSSEAFPMDSLLGVGTNFNSLVALYEGNCNYRDEEPFFKRQLEVDERTYGPDHPNVAWRLNNLADLYRALGRYTDAQPLFERALSLFRKLMALSTLLWLSF